MNEERIDFSMFLNEYLADARQGFQRANDALLAFEKEPGQKARLEDVARAFHTLKSSSAMIGFGEIATLAHVSEDLLGRIVRGEVPVSPDVLDLLFEIIDTLERMVKERSQNPAKWAPGRELAGKIERLTRTAADIAAKPGGQAVSGGPSAPKAGPKIEKIETVRVHMSLLDSLFNLVGELIISKNRIENLLADTANKELKAVLSSMEHMIDAMQETVSAARLVPVDEIFQKFPRMVRDLAREERKEIDFTVEGREIELDKSILDAVGEPLIHLLRNAVGHGIERPEEREARGKPRRGSVRLAARRTENHIVIVVEDDGAGIDIPLIREAAVRKGFLREEEAARQEDKEILNVLLSAGFTTAEEVTGLAGRGVGMNVVRKASMEMGGTVEMATEKDKGTRVSLVLPLTTAIVQTVLVGVGDHVFVIPSDIIVETLRTRLAEVRDVGERRLFVRGEEVIPYVGLDRALGIAGRGREEINVLIVRRGSRTIAVGVDAVLDHMDNIVKPLDPVAQQFRGFSGGTILGDGRVALLLDVPALFGFAMFQEERLAV